VTYVIPPSFFAWYRYREKARLKGKNGAPREGEPMGLRNREENNLIELFDAEVLRDGLASLKGRIADLRSFDVKTVQERYDKRIKTLADDVNATLADIFGQDTPRYWQHAITSLDTLPTVIGGARYPIDKVREVYQMGIDDAVTKLTTLAEKLEGNAVLDEPLPPVEEKTAEGGKPLAVKKKVCIVHGRDETARENVARLLSKLDLEAIILHDRTGEDRPVMEKLQAASPIDFTIFIMTPEDVKQESGNGTDGTNGKRQNVLIDFGYFLGTLGKDRVYILSSGPLSVAFDYYGVAQVPMDNSALWELLLARDMKRAGLAVDMNKAV
jgi:predicted nucleotide-binding protein